MIVDLVAPPSSFARTIVNESPCATSLSYACQLTTSAIMAVKQASAFITKARLHTTTNLRTLEVERKFIPTTSSITLLRTNTGVPPFSSHLHVGLSRTHDVYYDKGGKLMQAGIYLRQRNGKWEAKVRQGGNYTNSQFDEITNMTEIQLLARGVLDGERGKRDGKMFDLQNELSAVADFRTEREEWEVDNGVKVVLDKADFGCVVGEVEICERVDRGRMKERATVLDDRIERFIDRYEWAFPRGEKVVGKLEAWFRWKETTLGLKRGAALR